MRMAKCDSAGREWGGDGGQRGGHKIMCTCEILAVIKAVEPAKDRKKYVHTPNRPM